MDQLVESDKIKSIKHPLNPLTEEEIYTVAKIVKNYFGETREKIFFETIQLEEPEKSLHARMQVNLADLFEESSEQNQLIIETHSENLLLGILKHVREGKIDVNDIKINYVYMDDDGVSKIDPLTVNKKGGFDTKWRHGFFTEKLDLL